MSSSSSWWCRFFFFLQFDFKSSILLCIQGKKYDKISFCGSIQMKSTKSPWPTYVTSIVDTKHSELNLTNYNNPQDGNVLSQMHHRREGYPFAFQHHISIEWDLSHARTDRGNR